MIFPTFTTAAHFPYEIYHKNCDVTYMMIFNSIGLPVTQCPIGINRDGLPIGFQVNDFRLKNYQINYLIVSL